MNLRRDEASLVLLMAILIGIGWIMVFSTGAVYAAERGGIAGFYHLMRQIVATGIGCAGLMILARTPFAATMRYAPLGLAVTVVLMLAVFVPGLGHTAGRATRWLRAGPLSFQPVEVLKVVVTVWLAALLSREKAREAWSWPTWARIGGLLAAGVLLPILQRDFGSALMIMALGLTMIWIAGGQARFVALFTGVGAAAAALAILAEPYRIKRITSYLSSLGGGKGAYQTIQSLIAIGDGGIFGVGLGEGRQKLFYLPSAHADFIYAIVGEELGFVGGVALLALFLFILRAGLGVARASADRFPRLLAAGLTLLIVFQAFWHIAVALVLVPTKGLALPFVSYGGSSLIASMAAIGLLLRCAAEPAAGSLRPAPTLPVSGGTIWKGS